MKSKLDYANASMKEKYKAYGIENIGYLDIETSGLTGDFDIMLSWANLTRNVRTGKTTVAYDFVEKKDFDLAHKKRNADLIDKRITETVIDEINTCDLMIGHWLY